ncbi:FIP (Fungus-Induced Protein) Related [Caenorhabditis elegans]|uniref:FIP (Fungus-Induced Protein) Related n=1 Tax=Caenorhabditis elegans TaxID=6239 RepID=Q95Q19_CAEEL|nr:FIP (Fungus-Induced Protein) Related [Caenorhabditis elegans]CAC70119.1 FIP (Fungus-Induced Protein) Related [Caenorhabditis elegans]|eukprot:NP_502968.1 FIP (Fungus-Induced Protein) Related [Caenorhabditis elegans]
MKVFLLLLLVTLAYSQPDENNNGFIQNDDEYLPADLAKKCENYFDCQQYQTCIFGHCVRKCTSERDCPLGYICFKNGDGQRCIKKNCPKRCPYGCKYGECVPRPDSQ